MRRNTRGILGIEAMIEAASRTEAGEPDGWPHERLAGRETAKFSAHW